MSDYYTVSEFAKINGKDPGNIRRMLISGALKGEKIGKQWVIDKNVVYPEDKRVSSGNYHNWRKRQVILKENPVLWKSLLEMSSQLTKVYGDKLDRIVLYGSYARGEQTSESDVDLALILKDEQDETAHEKMTDIVIDYELDLGITLSVVSIEKKQYMEWNKVLPYYKNIAKEGIVLWKEI